MTKKVLIIDDETDLRYVIQAALVDFAGWEVSTAETCAVGLEVAKVFLPDLILLDISMPEVNGYQCSEKLQADVGTASIPVILLTGQVLPRDRRQFAAMNIAGVIAKPFNPIYLWQEISAIAWPHSTQ